MIEELIEASQAVDAVIRLHDNSKRIGNGVMQVHNATHKPKGNFYIQGPASAEKGKEVLFTGEAPEMGFISIDVDGEIVDRIFPLKNGLFFCYLVFSVSGEYHVSALFDGTLRSNVLTIAIGD